MLIDGATIIHLQHLQSLVLHPNYQVQGKRNWQAIRDLGVTQGHRVKQNLGVYNPKSGTQFFIPDDKAQEALQRLGICK